MIYSKTLLEYKEEKKIIKQEKKMVEIFIFAGLIVFFLNLIF